jgi:large subunit ribosomal protein L15
MKPHDLRPPEGAHTKAQRVGRGEGGRRGKTAGRGTKGTKARGRIAASFEGGQMPLVRRVPKLKGFKPPTRRTYGAVNLGDLAGTAGSEIGPEELKLAGLVRKRDRFVKILGEGEIGRALTVRAHAFSEAARAKIEAAGGTVEVIPARAGRTEGGAD